MFEPVFWWNPKTFSAWNLCFNHPQVFRKIRPSTIPNPGGNLGFSFELSRPRAHVWPLRVSVHLEMLRLEGKVTKHRKLLLGCADLCTWAFMRNGWPFFPSKWRANEKQGGGDSHQPGYFSGWIPIIPPKFNSEFTPEKSNVGRLSQGSLNYPFQGNQTMQTYGSFESLSFCLVWVANITTPVFPFLFWDSVPFQE